MGFRFLPLIHSIDYNDNGMAVPRRRTRIPQPADRLLQEPLLITGRCAFMAFHVLFLWAAGNMGRGAISVAPQQFNPPGMGGCDLFMELLSPPQPYT